MAPFSPGRRGAGLALSGGDGDWRAIAAAEAYLAGSSLTLAAAYGLKQAGVPVERLWDRSIVVRALLVPYKRLGHAVLGFTSRVGGEPARDEVVPGLWVGRYVFRDERDQLESLGINAVLDLCAELSGRAGCELTRVPILDGTPPSPRQFAEAVGWILARRDEGKVVLVHFAQGHGRSATVAAAALVRLGLAESSDAAVAMIRAVRPGARPSRSQREALDHYVVKRGPPEGGSPVTTSRR